MAPQAPTLIVPVESQVRELDAKILLSAVAAERGFSVIMGSRAYVHFGMADFPRGVYLAKSMRDKSDRMFDIIRKLGHHIVAFDEEGLVRFPDRFYYQRRISAKALRDVNILLAWGDDNARCLRAFDGFPGCPVEVTGNSRIDLLRPELRGIFQGEASRIRERFGPFVLVNTNFSGLNHFYDELSELKQHLESGDAEAKNEFMAGRAAFRKTIFDHFQVMIPALSRLLPEMQVIVRPHPSENHRAWVELTEGLENVQVLHDGNVFPWLLACKCLVHNGCTTGLESAIMGVPAIAFQPETDDVFDLQLPNAVSHNARSLNELEKMVRAVVEGEMGPPDDATRRAILDSHVAALDGPLASERMVDAIEKAGERGNGPPVPSQLDHAEAWVHVRGRNAVKWMNRNRPGHRNNLEFHRHRFPGVTCEEIEAKISEFGAKLGRFQGLRVSQRSEHIYDIRR